MKYKARLCIRGDLQPPTAQDTYAATLATRTFRALMAIAAAFDLEIWHLDAVNAFTNSTLDEVVHCAYPLGFEIQNIRMVRRIEYSAKVCRGSSIYDPEMELD